MKENRTENFFDFCEKSSGRKMLNWDTTTLVSELIHGMEAAKQLQSHIGESPSPSPESFPPTTETNESLVLRIVSSYEKALLMLNWAGPPPVQPVTPPAAAVIPVLNSGGKAESPASINGSPRSEELNQDYNFNPKKRKTMPKWTEKVRISPERGFEGPQDDGFSWRKYGQKDILASRFPRSNIPVTPPAAAVIPVLNSGGKAESPASINGSPRSEELNQDYNFNPKKRKTMPKWTEKVRISPERGFEGPQDDGFSWRKYGQKDILASRFPRSYYRCTYRNTQNCWATKQVQRSDGDPAVFEVTYRGTHTCSQAIPPPASPETQDAKSNKATGNYQNDPLHSLGTNLGVDAFSFPAATLFYDDSDFGFCHVGGSDPSDFPGLMMSSANTSTGSSPIFDVDFQFDPTVEIDTGFTSFFTRVDL
ncbi:PREDICTED: probable WRKY transcription factor 41 [Tarenaya hassleriana]|uniref:probable WRKY transcription factor 41 n=1 Tax=Tarenaya hassleriana TaxID=28532 RepID=UPI0008FD3FB2|nr:PREDICTED: probable WRKY transcription factor 41 [Tarenaya hassleriana]